MLQASATRVLLCPLPETGSFCSRCLLSVSAKKLRVLFDLRTPGGSCGWSPAAPYPVTGHLASGPWEGLGQPLLAQPGQFLVCFSPCPSSPAHLLSFSTAPAPWSNTDHLESENTLVHSVGVLGPWEFCLHDSEEGKHAYLETLLFYTRFFSVYPYRAASVMVNFYKDFMSEAFTHGQ